MSRPLAIGVVHVSTHASRTTRSRARTEVSAYADAEGFALAELFEVDGRAAGDASALAVVADLAERTGAAVIVSAWIDPERMAGIAARVRLVATPRPSPHSG